LHTKDEEEESAEEEIVGADYAHILADADPDSVEAMSREVELLETVGFDYAEKTEEFEETTD